MLAPKDLALSFGNVCRVVESQTTIGEEPSSWLMVERFKISRRSRSSAGTVVLINNFTLHTCVQEKRLTLPKLPILHIGLPLSEIRILSL